MRIFIASDIHGSAVNLEKFFSIVDSELPGHPDTKVVLLGDTYNHGPRNPLPEGYAPMRVAKLLNDAMSFITVIKGNCDSEVDEMISNFPIIGDFGMEWNGRTVYFTHGHKVNPDSPQPRAKAGGRRVLRTLPQAVRKGRERGEIRVRRLGGHPL